MNNEIMNQDNNKILIYTSDDGQIKIEVRLEDENVWLTQNAMAELFNTTKQNISLHIKNIFEEKELDENSVVKENLTTASDGKNYKTKFYNLDLIISVGYRVKSIRGTQFRIWANKLIKEYLIKGYNLNVDRFKNNGGGVCFEELLEKRPIFTSLYHLINEELIKYKCYYEESYAGKLHVRFCIWASVVRHLSTKL